jgi:hypothetical protein
MTQWTPEESAKQIAKMMETFDGIERYKANREQELEETAAYNSEERPPNK